MADSDERYQPTLKHPVGSRCKVPEVDVLIRTLDPFQLACLAIEGMLSERITDDTFTMYHLELRTGSKIPVDARSFRGDIGQWIKTLEVARCIRPLHLFWLSETGCLDPLYTLTRDCPLRGWIAATVAPWHLPASFYDLHEIDPTKAYQYPPRYNHDPDMWRQLFNKLCGEVSNVGSSNKVKVEGDQREAEEPPYSDTEGEESDEADDVKAAA